LVLVFILSGCGYKTDPVYVPKDTTPALEDNNR